MNWADVPSARCRGRVRLVLEGEVDRAEVIADRGPLLLLQEAHDDGVMLAGDDRGVTALPGRGAESRLASTVLPARIAAAALAMGNCWPKRKYARTIASPRPSLPVSGTSGKSPPNNAPPTTPDREPVPAGSPPCATGPPPAPGVTSPADPDTPPGSPGVTTPPDPDVPPDPDPPPPGDDPEQPATATAASTAPAARPRPQPLPPHPQTPPAAAHRTRPPHPCTFMSPTLGNPAQSTPPIR